ncbi:deoxyuridine 5'-triphosphate nucleotidohydrolase [Tripterygium wilfordii]|uniref:Deoxyuridine 5'-triphosphate nucleotidohydrolase n=1 Tax=Tripterygium wilfordii TaxID=458696 RepID=A0A7J7DLK2_TRIWF|nr:deoxyuridine 5'-triphosphate nucleotidohydrolase-like [Tripterygium wilfordii]KAF5747104.1 deoxyuridine 5'-triphosphate nucleotidohydrolase [Tripterygium wilfordii]
MARIVGATFWKTPRLAPLFLYDRVFKSSFYSHTNPLRATSHSLRVFRMAQADEPSPKMQNGVNEASQNPIPLIRVKKLSEKAVLPSRASSLSAGYDLSSAIDAKVPARGKSLIQTDLSIAVPEGTYARIAPRSGLAWKHSIDVGAGVIDADYRGPVGVILFNHSDVDFQVGVGDRIAQLIIEKIMTPAVVELEDLDETVRGDGGFGSTGV